MKVFVIPAQAGIQHYQIWSKLSQARYDGFKDILKLEIELYD
jgi:hypothetical protein